MLVLWSKLLTPEGWLQLLALLLVVSIGARALDASPQSQGGGGGNAGTPPQKFYKEWKMADLLPSVVDLGTGHDWTKGRELFQRAACGGCHAFGRESEGSGLAPDLASVATRFTRDFILQSILEPSATINGQYFHTKFTLKSGDVITGTIIDIVDKKILVAPVMLTPDVIVEVAEADVKSEEPSTVSPMPAGLLNEFTKEEVVELLAFLDAGGDRNAPMYTKR